MLCVACLRSPEGQLQCMCVRLWVPSQTLHHGLYRVGLVVQYIASSSFGPMGRPEETSPWAWARVEVVHVPDTRACQAYGK